MTNQGECKVCGDSLALHIGQKPCVGTYATTYAERRAQAVRDQERKRVVRLFGKDAI